MTAGQQMTVIDSFSLKNRTIAVLGGEGLLGGVAVQTISDLGGKPISIDIKTGADYVCDIANDATGLFFLAEHHSYSGVVNCVVGNQGAVPTPEWYYDDDLQVGLVAAKTAHQAFHKALHRTRGVFLNVGSDLSLRAPDPQRYDPMYKPLSYSVVKHGIIGMTRYYAALWGKEGIRVNCLCPGSIDQGQAVPRCALGRLAHKDEMAGAIAWLLSDASSYVTGAVISVDGGSTI